MKFTFHYTGLRVRDLDACLRFFVEGLGMRESSREKIPETGGVVVYLQSEGKEHPLELNWYPPGSRFDSPYNAGEALDHLAFHMEAGVRLEEAIAHLERHGGRLRIAPFPEGGGRIAYVDSPDGHTVELYERGA
ncbi:MAG TPA: VOC family protein [Candidatus Thermoplasmatota archaeon]|nr:VOC family protein [Candidatus Thermoplasmatota archaeon]